MKTINEVTWLYCMGVKYTHDPYQGASQFHYGWKNHITGNSGASIIYGVNKKKGMRLIEYWNQVNPTVWSYHENLAATTLNQPKFQVI